MLMAPSFSNMDLLGEKTRQLKDAIIGRGQAQSVEIGGAIWPSEASCGVRYKAGEARLRHGNQELDQKEQ